MVNPYSDRPSYTYWRNAVSDCPALDVDPVVSSPLRLTREDKIATAGSCFAQHISRTLHDLGYAYLVTESYSGRPGTVDESYGVFPARFGNIYTSRQLVQLFKRAYGLFRPSDRSWKGKEGGFLDPFRPRVQMGGFPSVEYLEMDRVAHLAAVRKMFEDCGAFIFTFGLTEYWASTKDGAVVPLPPGVVSNEEHAYTFGNLTVSEIIADTEEFLSFFRRVNPKAKIIFTVSPVALIATFEDRHVLVSTIASKAKLRAAVDEVCSRHQDILYFPSYEIIAGPQAKGRFFADDLREVTSEGVSHVMSFFQQHILEDGPVTETRAAPGHEGSEAKVRTVDVSPEQERAYRALLGIVCDEEALVTPQEQRS